MKNLILFFLVYTFHFSSFADNQEWLTCTIKGVYEVSEDGKFQELGDDVEVRSLTNYFKKLLGVEVKPSVFGFMIDKVFTISRLQGKYRVYPAISNLKSKITILDKGSEQQSFKVLSIKSGSFKVVQYLEIDLYKKSHLKPFKLINQSIVMFSGTCVYD